MKVNRKLAIAFILDAQSLIRQGKYQSAEWALEKAAEYLGRVSFKIKKEGI